ncbi:MAG: 2-amino-4-hydroxy-6-hydroxymethyldihydropteridine diphosphokinase [Anaerolineales bacterium]
MATVYLALGSNLGDRLANLRAALAALPPAARVLDTSHIYETAPWGYAEQPNFFNMAARLETELSPQALLDFLKGLESRLGRIPNFQNGPRLIDLDLLFYDDLVLNTPPLVIPHPRLHERAFVLIPLADLAPDLVHPVLGETIWRLLGNVSLKDIHKAVISEQ